MPAQNDKDCPFADFDPQRYEQEVSSAMKTYSVMSDAQWAALIDPAVDAVVNNWTATAAQKAIFKAFFKAQFHAIRVNRIP